MLKQGDLIVLISDNTSYYNITRKHSICVFYRYDKTHGKILFQEGKAIDHNKKVYCANDNSDFIKHINSKSKEINILEFF